MKRIIILWVAAAFFLSSCTDYLEVKTYGKAIPKTSEEFAALLHNHLNKLDYGLDFPLLENSSELLSMESVTDNYSVALTTPSGTTLPKYIGDLINNKQSRYEQLYALIRDMNIILENMPAANTDADKNVMGTAYGMRAIAYYHLLREFCEPYASDEQPGLPLVRSFDMEGRPIRSNYGATMAFIEADFEQARSYAVSDELYRYTDDVVKAYQARFFFWTRQWARAAELAAEIVQEYPLLSGSAYTEMIQSKNTLAGNMLVRSYLFPGNQDLAYINTQSLIKTRPLKKDFVDLFEEEERDVRYSLSFNRMRLTQKVLTGKVRAAEFQLILAESYAHMGQIQSALDHINELRSHRIAGYTNLGIQDLPAVDLTATVRVDAEGQPLTPLMQLILNERRKELFAEGDRFFELKRNGRPSFWQAYNGLKYTTQPFLYTFPIPRIDVELTPGLVQNDGYSF